MRLLGIPHVMLAQVSASEMTTVMRLADNITDCKEPVYRYAGIMKDAILPLTTDAIDPARPAGPQVFALLNDAIMTMQLSPGQAVSEAEIGARLGVSRTPVREALAQLRALNLVDTRPSRGSFVTRLNAAGLREAQYLREALEIANVQRVIETGFAGDVRDALDHNLREQERAVQGVDYAGFHSLDDAFHRLIAEGTGFPRAAQVLAHEKAQLDRLRMLSLHDPQRLHDLLADHRALFEAIVAQDLAGAIAVAKRHLRGVLAVLDLLATRNAAFFDPA